MSKQQDWVRHLSCDQPGAPDLQLSLGSINLPSELVNWVGLAGKRRLPTHVLQLSSLPLSCLRPQSHLASIRGRLCNCIDR